MMNFPLTLTTMLRRGTKLFPKKEIVSRTQSGIFRYTLADYGQRTRQLSSALQTLGLQRGDRVGTFAWNNHRHMEAYFAVPCMGAILHTINIRLSAEHIIYIINHAEDKVLLIDEDLVPLIENVKDQLKCVQHFVIMTDKPELPATTLEPVYSYESFIQKGDPEFVYPEDLDENTPMGMCYTSATTGNPKGVVYSHRAVVLHSMSEAMADTLAVSENDTLMPVVPMFHVNAWGIPFTSVWLGSKIVLPGPVPTPKVLLELIQQEKVTLTAGVPTVWLGILKALEEGEYDTSSLRGVVNGGSAAPREMIKAYEDKWNIPFIHAYGMTETTPLVLVSRLKSYQQDLSRDEILDIKAKQGLLVPGLEMKVVAEHGEVAWNGQEMGELLLRGPWIADAYYNDERTASSFSNGWLHTGDVAVVDQEGTVKLVDRMKDLIKSGGEWISSVDLENSLMAHPAVYEACVIGVPHPTWQERPVACVVLKEAFADKVNEKDFQNFLGEKFAKWWIPDRVLFMETIPKTSVGKFLKRALRETLKDFNTIA
jgi:fatty-acyl-CoA synthase